MAKSSRLGGFFGIGATKTEPVKPREAQGVPGYYITGGYIVSKEKNAALAGKQRYTTYSDLLQNTAIIAAGTRYFLNIISQPEWSIQPALDLGDDSSDEAKQVAELVEDILFNGMATNWTRLVRRAGQYRYYGFAIEEWIAKKRDDGRFGIYDVRARPQWTVERWDIADNGDVLGVWQRSPQTGAELYIPRGKMIYLLDDTLTDSPDGIGLFRQVTESAQRLRELLRLEATGFSRDMRGLPIARAPLAEMERSEMTEADKAAALRPLEDFVGIEAKDKDTYLLVDSATYRSTTDNGESVSNVPLWGVEFAKVSASGLDEIGKAIERLNYDIARVLGVEGLMIGTGSSGSRAAAEDKSSNLHLQANAAMDDIQEAYQRDLIGAVMRLNAIPEELTPTLTHEDVQKKDIEMLSAFFRNVAAAGVPMSRDDEAVKELFASAGFTPPESDALLGMMDSAASDEAVTV